MQAWVTVTVGDGVSKRMAFAVSVTVKVRLLVSNKAKPTGYAMKLGYYRHYGLQVGGRVRLDIMLG